MVMALQRPEQPAIFKINVDCFEELFDWLSLKDLHAFGQSCKKMQKAAGYHMSLTYPKLEAILLGDIYCTGMKKISGFSDHILNLKMESFNRMDSFEIANANEFESLKKIRLSGIPFDDDERMACIKKFLVKVETVEVFDCVNNEHFYEQFLKHCVNMKVLRVGSYGGLTDFDWLCRSYPNLENMVLELPHQDLQIDQLITFFQVNPNVKHFATTGQVIFAIRELLISSNIKLDVLSVRECFYNVGICALLTLLSQRGLFKRLHLYGGTENIVSEIFPGNTVEKIAFFDFPENDITVIHFSNLKEFTANRIPEKINVEVLACILGSLERIHLSEANINQIFTFIRCSQKLAHISVTQLDEVDHNVLDLGLWNTERANLTGARKVTVYVDEEIYLATKYATQNKEYQLIGMKRIQSHRIISDFRRYDVL